MDEQELKEMKERLKVVERHIGLEPSRKPGETTRFEKKFVRELTANVGLEELQAFLSRATDEDLSGLTRIAKARAFVVLEKKVDKTHLVAASAMAPAILTMKKDDIWRRLLAAVRPYRADALKNEIFLVALRRHRFLTGDVGYVPSGCENWEKGDYDAALQDAVTRYLKAVDDQG